MLRTRKMDDEMSVALPIHQTTEREMTKHTEGPWEILEGITISVVNSNREFICGVHDKNIPNARLISAATDLLASLEDMKYALELCDRERFAAILDKARAAIAKARGE